MSDEANNGSLAGENMDESTYSVTVTATYVGAVDVRAATPQLATERVKAGLGDGSLHVDLAFSGYTGIDFPELLTGEQDQLGDLCSEVAHEDSHWYVDPDYPLSDWQNEVVEDNTRQGYRDWVASQREIDGC